jgi:hypothetical protein
MRAPSDGNALQEQAIVTPAGEVRAARVNSIAVEMRAASEYCLRGFPSLKSKYPRAVGLRAGGSLLHWV